MNGYFCVILLVMQWADREGCSVSAEKYTFSGLGITPSSLVHCYFYILLLHALELHEAHVL